MKSNITQILCIVFVLLIILSCSPNESTNRAIPEAVLLYPLPEVLNPQAAQRLTERFETENYIFYYAPGDTIQFERCEAFAVWAIDYFGVTLHKRIEYFKFRSAGEMEQALPSPANGWAFPEEVAFATRWKWHNHELVHVLAHWWANNNHPPPFFSEGLAVAHEFDPYNDSWISRWNRDEIREPWIDYVKRLNTEGKLYPLSSILDSYSFWEQVSQEQERIAYPQAGMFVDYLIKLYGLEKMRQIYSTLNNDDTQRAIETRFENVYGLSLEQAEQDWLTYLDTE